jgi:hypothetical protein
MSMRKLILTIALPELITTPQTIMIYIHNRMVRLLNFCTHFTIIMA